MKAVSYQVGCPLDETHSSGWPASSLTLTLRKSVTKAAVMESKSCPDMHTLLGASGRNADVCGERRILAVMNAARRSGWRLFWFGVSWVGPFFSFSFFLYSCLVHAKNKNGFLWILLTWPVTFLSKQGLIFRFKFLMLITLACAAMTVIFFIVSQVSVTKFSCVWEHQP